MDDYFRAIRADSMARRKKNRENGLRILDENGVVYRVKNGGAHIIVTSGDTFIDYWPGTGRWKPRNEPTRTGYGVFNLIIYMRRTGGLV